MKTWGNISHILVSKFWNLKAEKNHLHFISRSRRRRRREEQTGCCSVSWPLCLNWVSTAACWSSPSLKMCYIVPGVKDPHLVFNAKNSLVFLILTFFCSSRLHWSSFALPSLLGLADRLTALWSAICSPSGWAASRCLERRGGRCFNTAGGHSLHHQQSGQEGQDEDHL